jgi:hypothetical protein
MNTERDLIQRMADELDHYRQLLRDDCTSTHPFADEARAYLAQPEPEGPTDEGLLACIDVLSGQWEWDMLSQCTGWKEFRDKSEKILRAARRPKPSLKEQAWKLLECYGTSGVKLTADQCNTILRALKTIPDDWGVKLTADQCNTILRALEAIPDD